MRVKRSQLAGTWYPGSAAVLRTQIDEWLAAAAAPGPAGTVRGVIVPHAGYQYSGRAAAAGYASVQPPGQPAHYHRAILLAPSHYSAFRGVALLDVDAFATPLGEVAVDRDAVAALAATPLCAVDPVPFREEHSLEIQLPLLQRVLPQARVVPLLVGQLQGDDYGVVAAAVAALTGAGTLCIVSSDFVHYGWRFDYLPFPATGAAAVRDGLRALDMGAIERVCAGDADGFLAYVDATGATICGRMPIAVFLHVPPRPVRGRLLTYYTSLDVTGDYEHTVSYASILLQ